MAALQRGRVVQSPQSFRLVGWGCASSTSLLAFAPCVTARFTRACFVDGQLAALDFRILQPCNGCLGLTGIGHLNKSKTAWPACFTVGDEIDAPYLTIGFEEFANFLWLGCKRDIAHKNLHRLSLLVRGYVHASVAADKAHGQERAWEHHGACCHPQRIRSEARSQRKVTQALC